ncbi:MAG: mechanosensitive ion channel [Fuerstiella sp.]|nr:mechanosensitive ion channel [Fuerstiella sp.]MCP4510149.1 mechanosensitive ion channel [Fuerstiella sp.]MDG2126593.1 mechanosensitive ion channel [Fuerstiella sp.]
MNALPLKTLAQTFTPGTAASAAQTTKAAAPGQHRSLIEASLDWLQSHLTLGWLIEQVVLYGPKLLYATAVFVVGRWLAKVVTSAIIRGAGKAKVDETLLGFLNNVIYMLLFTVVCVAAVESLGVDTTGLTAVLAATGFAIGFALQGSLGNLAAGVMLVFFKPFRVGDVVEIESLIGTVVEIQICNTILLTLDNVRIIVPNSKMTDGTIKNYSAEPHRRIDLVVGCGYNDNLKAVKKVLQDLLTEDSRILTSPEPVVAVSELGDSSVNFVVRPWVSSHEYWAVRFDLTERIKLAFDECGFTIPFPSQDLFVHRPDASDQPAGILKAA